MSTATLETQLIQFNLKRQRFESRLRYFSRCIEDITTDFHKLYGPYCNDWQSTQEACALFRGHIEDYLRSRDVIAIEFKLLLGAIAEANTKYAIAKAKKRFVEIMQICGENDQQTLAEIDEDVSSIRNIYKMIHVEECGS